VAAHGPKSVDSALPGELPQGHDSGVGSTEPDRIRAHTMFFPISEWFGSFVLTLAVEAPIVCFAFRNAEIGLPRLAVLFVFANLATHLAVWYVWTQIFDVASPEYVVASETWAALAEAIFYGAAIRGITTARAIGVAVAANLASAVAGAIVTTLWPTLLS
jgi:hypothetical protein